VIVAILLRVARWVCRRARSDSRCLYHDCRRATTACATSRRMRRLRCEIHLPRRCVFASNQLRCIVTILFSAHTRTHSGRCAMRHTGARVRAPIACCCCCTGVIACVLLARTLTLRAVCARERRSARRAVRAHRRAGCHTVASTGGAGFAACVARAHTV
jgi:hypothetical protein